MPETASSELIRRFSIPGLAFLLGMGIGVGVEGHTDTVAERKLLTAQICANSVQLDDVITRDFEKCVEDGVPGGTNIGGNRFDTGDPSLFVDAYIAEQRNEVGLEPERLIIWGIAGVVALKLGTR